MSLSLLYIFCHYRKKRITTSALYKIAYQHKKTFFVLPGERPKEHKFLILLRLVGTGTKRRGRSLGGSRQRRKPAWNTAPGGTRRGRASDIQRVRTRRGAPFRPLNGSCCLIRCKKLEEASSIVAN